MNHIDIDRINLNRPLPAPIFKELPFKTRFRARWLDLKELIEASLPRTFFWCSMLLRQERFNLMVTSMPRKANGKD